MRLRPRQRKRVHQAPAGAKTTGCAQAQEGHVEHRSRGEHLDLHADLHRFVQPIVDGERNGVVSCAQARVKQQPVHAFGRQAAVKVAGPDHVEVLRATGRLTGQHHHDMFVGKVLHEASQSLSLPH